MDINKIRKFPEVFDEYINSNNIYGEIIINYDLPYYLNTKDACYKFLLSEDFFESLNGRKRVLLINIEKKWNEHQSVALRDSTFSAGEGEYSFQSTSLQIFIQIFKDEIGKIDKLFKEKNFFAELMQKTLELLIIKYNINKNGDYFITPSASDCSMICIFLYKNWINTKESINFYISLNNNNNNTYEFSEDKYEDSLNICIYRYFFNKAKYSKNNFDYIDTIVSGAIALESYIYFILRANILLEEEIEKYTFDKSCDKYYSVFQLIRKLIEDQYIINKNNISYSKLREYVSDVLSPRNNLMHGKLKDFISLKNKSIKSFEGLIKLFNNLEMKYINSNENREIEIVIPYNKQISKKIIKEAMSLKENERKDKLKEALTYDSTNSFIYLELGNEEVNKNNFDLAIKLYEKAIKFTNMKDELLNNIAVAYTRKGEYSKAITYFNMVTDMPKKDRRGFCRNSYLKEYGECYLLLSRNEFELNKLKMNKELSLKKAEDLLKKIDGEYYRISSYENLITIYIDIKKYEKAIVYCDKILKEENRNINVLKNKAYCYLKIKKFQNCIEVLESLFIISNLKLKNDDIKQIKMMLTEILIFDKDYKDKFKKLIFNLQKHGNRF